MHPPDPGFGPVPDPHVVEADHRPPIIKRDRIVYEIDALL